MIYMSFWMVFINIALLKSIKEKFLVFKETERARRPTLKSRKVIVQSLQLLLQLLVSFKKANQAKRM